MIDGGEARTLGGDDLGHVLVQPEVEQRLGIEGEDRHRAATDPTQLAQAGVDVTPLVDGDHRHRGVEAVVVERQALGRRVERGSKMKGSLCSHRRGRLDGHHVAIERLVGAGARTHVDDRPRVAEGGVNQRRDPRIRLSAVGVSGAVRLVVEVARRCLPCIAHGMDPSTATAARLVGRHCP
jgi:hypothetical protein